MKNTNFSAEKIMANKFIQDHSYDNDFMIFITNMYKFKKNLTHSERWSEIYDWMEDHYPEATGSLITGLTYFCEE